MVSKRVCETCGKDESGEYSYDSGGVCDSCGRYVCADHFSPATWRCLFCEEALDKYPWEFPEGMCFGMCDARGVPLSVGCFVAFLELEVRGAAPESKVVMQHGEVAYSIHGKEVRIRRNCQDTLGPIKHMKSVFVLPDVLNESS